MSHKTPHGFRGCGVRISHKHLTCETKNAHSVWVTVRVKLPTSTFHDNWQIVHVFERQCTIVTHTLSMWDLLSGFWQKYQNGYARVPGESSARDVVVVTWHPDVTSCRDYCGLQGSRMYVVLDTRVWENERYMMLINFGIDWVCPAWHKPFRDPPRNITGQSLNITGVRANICLMMSMSSRTARCSWNPIPPG